MQSIRHDKNVTNCSAHSLTNHEKRRTRHNVFNAVFTGRERGSGGGGGGGGESYGGGGVLVCDDLSVHRQTLIHTRHETLNQCENTEVKIQTA